MSVFKVMYVSQERDQFFGGDQFMFERFLEKYYNARQYRTVPQTDTGRYVEKTKAHERNIG